MLYHTSRVKIEKVEKFGGDGECLFESFLCFSNKPYWLSGKEPEFFYEIDEDVLNICEACHIFYDENARNNAVLDEIVKDVMNRFDVDEDTAESLIDESKDLLDYDADGDDGWWLQLQTAKAARSLGYDGCRMTDEQGSVYFIDMFGKEHLWKIADKSELHY